MRKKFLLLFWFTVCMTSVHAQYVFNNCGSIPAFGDSLIGLTSEYDTANVSPGSAGANVTWNYSSLIFKYTYPIVHYYENPVLTLGDSMFSKSTLADSTTTGVTSYFTYNNDSVAFLGNYHDQYDYYYAWDPEKQMVCPLSFGNSFSDSFNGYSFGQCPQHRIYTNRTITYDAYGTFNMTKKSYSVARLKIVEHTLDSAICAPPITVSHQVDTIYMWYDINTGQPIFSWQCYLGLDTANNSLTKLVEFYGYSHLPVFFTGVQSLDEQQSDINVFPNPTSGKFTVANDKLQTANDEIEIYNVMGEKVFQSFNLQVSRSAIDLSSQPNGIYFLKVRTDKGSFSQKIVKE